MACLEYCSALASVCTASGEPALPCKLRGSVCPSSASVETSLGAIVSSFSPYSCIFCVFPVYGALAYAYLQTGNTQKMQECVETSLGAIVSSFSPYSCIFCVFPVCR